jgi:predicted N-acetyltransferase YhbS
MQNATALAAPRPKASCAKDLLLLFTERAEDAVLVEGLIDRAFGPGRYAKTAERLREARAPDRALSFVAWSGGRAIGCVRQWPVLVGETPAVFLGPIAVEEERRREGLGASLIRRACEAAREAGHGHILLVGDMPIFGPFGFTAEAARRVVLPGPVDRRRVLALALGAGPASELSGPVRVIAA